MADRPFLDSEGWQRSLRRVPSPNFDDRPQGTEVDLVVIHAISLPPDQFGGPGIIELFTNQLNPEGHPYFRDIAQLRVSSHFLIRRDGEVIQFVSCAKRAWHAGRSTWRGREACNDYSIGIELEGCDRMPFEGAQYASLDWLLGGIRTCHAIQDVVGHSDVAPGRKTDPGPCFDWHRVLPSRN